MQGGSSTTPSSLGVSLGSTVPGDLLLPFLSVELCGILFINFLEPIFVAFIQRFLAERGNPNLR